MEKELRKVEDERWRMQRACFIMESFHLVVGRTRNGIREGKIVQQRIYSDYVYFLFGPLVAFIVMVILVLEDSVQAFP